MQLNLLIFKTFYRLAALLKIIIDLKFNFEKLLNRKVGNGKYLKYFHRITNRNYLCVALSSFKMWIRSIGTKLRDAVSYEKTNTRCNVVSLST